MDDGITSPKLLVALKEAPVSAMAEIMSGEAPGKDDVLSEEALIRCWTCRRSWGDRELD